MNYNITPKERGLLKGAIRRVFSRSDLRRAVLEACRTDYMDSKRPRVKKWGICNTCKQHEPLYLMQVDHIDPIVPVEKTLEQMSWDTVVDRVWCDKNNLQCVCKECHHTKTKEEGKLRREFKKRNKL